MKNELKKSSFKKSKFIRNELKKRKFKKCEFKKKYQSYLKKRFEYLQRYLAKNYDLVLKLN